MAEEEVTYPRPRIGEPSEEELSRPAEETSPAETIESKAKVVRTDIIPSESLSTFIGPRIASITEEIGIPLPPLPTPQGPGVPFIGRTRFETPRTGWYEVTYDEMTEPPTIIAQSEHRDGWYEPKALFSPQKLDEGEIARRSRQGAETAVKRHLGDWKIGILGVGISLNFIRDTIAWAIGVAAYVQGYFTAWIANMILDTLAAHATASAYKGIDRLHQFSGRPQMMLTTPEVRDLTERTAQVLGYEGSHLDIIVMGSKKVI